ncbi:MAG: hypothetical protein PSV22_04690 [Pseudolabrys sp.]|nr:hypothetical protein [Pseudolabrys sp.]
MYAKDPAKALIEILVRHGGELDDHLRQIEPQCSVEEFKAHKHLVGTLLGSILLDGLNVLVVEFPELKPALLK